MDDDRRAQRRDRLADLVDVGEGVLGKEPGAEDFAGCRRVGDADERRAVLDHERRPLGERRCDVGKQPVGGFFFAVQVTEKGHRVDEGGGGADGAADAADCRNIGVVFGEPVEGLQHSAGPCAPLDGGRGGSNRLCCRAKRLFLNLGLAFEGSVVDGAAQSFRFDRHAEGEAEIFKAGILLHVAGKLAHQTALVVGCRQGMAGFFHNVDNGGVHHAARTDDRRTVNGLPVQNPQQPFLWRKNVAHGSLDSAAPEGASTPDVCGAPPACGVPDGASTPVSL